MLNWFLDFRISGRRPRAGRPIGRAAGGGSNGGDGTVQEEERAAKSGPMLRGPERFFRSGERARARGLDPGHESRPDLHSLLALQLRVGVVARSPVRGRPLQRAPTGAAGVRKEGKEPFVAKRCCGRRRRRHESFFFLLLNSQRVVRKASRAGVGDLKTEADAVDAIFLR